MCLGFKRKLSWSRVLGTGWKPVLRATVCSLILALIATPTWGGAPTTQRVLRVGADPNNLPFSNDKLEGFENKIAVIVAKDLGAEIQYAWRAQRRGFFRESFKTDGSDLIMGAPKDFDKALTTTPYYQSSYVFVSRKDRKINVTSFDDEALKSLKIGVQLTGEANTPPAQALGRRDMWKNVVGFTVYGDYKEPNPPAAIVGAVAKGDVDIAVVWGPLAGYFAKAQNVELTLAPVSPDVDEKVPMAFDISMAVAKKNTALRDELNAVIQKRKVEIQQILDEYGVPKSASVAVGAR